MNANHMALLDKVTDTRPQALAEVRQAMDLLADVINRLTVARSKKEDELSYLCYLAGEAMDAVDGLAEELEL